MIDVVDATYIIMQRVDGPELTEYLCRHPHRRLTPEIAATLLCHLLAALRHAHRHGFLHCDVKPDNVRLNKACNHAVLTDWGYARRPGEKSTGYFCGTPAYASPEQLTGYSPDSVTGRRKLCPATDVWSLGVTLFEMVTGSLPFPAEDHQQLVQKVLSTKYTLPDHVPRPVAALIEGMLALAPNDRLDVDEMVSSPHLKKLGVQVPTEVKPRTLSLEDSFHMQCGDAVDDSELADGMRIGSGNGGNGKKAACPDTTHFLGSPLFKRVMWTCVYALLCAGAIWSHVQSGDGSSEETHYHYQL